METRYPTMAIAQTRHCPSLDMPAAGVETIRGCSRQEQTPAGASRYLVIIIKHTHRLIGEVV